MSDHLDEIRWTKLDRDLNRISRAELAASYAARPLVAPGLALAFIVLVGLSAALFFGQTTGGLVVVAAAIFGAYMAMNIGANDVANNMGPAVGANALRMGTAICIAALAESAGALLAGGAVVETIAKNIVDPTAMQDAQVFIWAMLAALISSALWVNFATLIRAPISTTHSVVGGVMGAGVAAAGLAAVNWPMMGAIAASWVIAPLLGGLIAAAILALIKASIQDRDDKIAAARVWVPILVAVMAGAFAAYLAVQGLQRVVKVELGTALLIGLFAGGLAWSLTVPWVRRKSAGMENRARSLKSLFGLPLIVAATLLSFAHGANDLANAVGPVAAIVHTSQFGAFAAQVPVPGWVMAIGAFGISFGLFLFGPRLIRMVGTQITKLNPMRAFCVALSTAITVLLASWQGLPVSSTHIAVGSVFGVGFYREWHNQFRQRRAPTLRQIATEERRHRKLVRRSHFMTILAAWMVTVPATALLSATLFTGLTIFM
ncbi:anion permease [Ruegeria sp. 2205SS24-7]|uniref:inorganic phosphate transporter n=1 Tax=Ruegeria discodermiae TaxID=3064389 RepID=UPI00274103F3|nr:inorganic phosphate transporter [Ruegeria sp. 2205SS24-7]MDP5216988.1 anion permease [Ruegeria sp. 2205SS24-7]